MNGVFDYIDFNYDQTKKSNNGSDSIDADRFNGDQIFANYLNYIPTVVATFET